MAMQKESPNIKGGFKKHVALAIQIQAKRWYVLDLPLTVPDSMFGRCRWKELEAAFITIVVNCSFSCLRPRDERSLGPHSAAAGSHQESMARPRKRKHLPCKGILEDENTEHFSSYVCMSVFDFVFR